MSEASAAATAAPPSSTSSSPSSERLRKHLEILLTSLDKREPLDPSYDMLLPPALRKKLISAANGGGSADPKSASVAGGKKSQSTTADAKLHRRCHANLRETVETFASTPAGWRRRPNARRVDVDFGIKLSSSEKKQQQQALSGGGMDGGDVDAKLRAAFALRESKEHEQRDLVAATLKAESVRLRRAWGLSVVGQNFGGGVGGGMMTIQPHLLGMMPPLEESSARKRRLDGIVKQLRDVERSGVERNKMARLAAKGREQIFNSRPATSASTNPSGDATAKNASATRETTRVEKDNRETKRKREESDLERGKIEQAKKRERGLRERLERQELENERRLEGEREERERRERALETPRDALHRLYEPIFSALWDMEFSKLGGSNPFRMVIDASTCNQMGIPDYIDVVKKPMNLTFIQTKVHEKTYNSLQEFVDDLTLMVNNALLYNSNTDNEYHIAAKDLRRKIRKLVKPVLQTLTKGKKLS